MYVATLQAGHTALYCAAVKGRTAVVEVLVATGAGMNIATTKVNLITQQCILYLMLLLLHRVATLLS